MAIMIKEYVGYDLKKEACGTKKTNSKKTTPKKTVKKPSK